MAEKSQDVSGRYIIAAFWSIVLLGIPLWWKTTEVYRSSLPVDEIQAWQMQQHKIALPTNFTLFITDDITANDIASSLELSLTSAFNELSTCVDFPVSVTHKSWSVPENWKDGFKYALNNHAEAPIGHYFIYLGAYQPHNLLQEKDFNITIGSGRVTVIQMRQFDRDIIQDMLQTFIPLLYATEFGHLGRTACLADFSGRNDMNGMRMMKYASKYQVTFSLMNNNPLATNVEWDIRDAVNAYLGPLLRELSPISNFTVDSQIQIYAPLSLMPHSKQREGTLDYYYYDPQELPHFINSAEWNLASTISSHPTVNFILFVPSHKESPLYIHDSQGYPLLNNAFLIPRWGGVAVKNIPKSVTVNKQHRITKQEIQPVMAIFISQLRVLMGIHDLQKATTGSFPSSYNVTFLPASRTGITALEKDSLLRRRTIENVMNSVSTLHSLSNLVTEIPNMVILDHISIQISQSLDSLRLVCDTLRAGDYEAALHHSIGASELSENAFFDPTMVSMLYFPDEHKYAIYMPLFVPISVPLLMALLKEIKKARKRAQEIKNE